MPPRPCCDTPDYLWERAVNEDGWLCINCGQLGFRPDLDRTHTDTKVDSLLRDLHDHDFIYISNNTHGEIVVARVVKRCKRANRYDQYSIVQFIYEDKDVEHGRFWQDRARAWYRNYWLPEPSVTVQGQNGSGDVLP